MLDSRTAWPKLPLKPVKKFDPKFWYLLINKSVYWSLLDFLLKFECVGGPVSEVNYKVSWIRFVAENLCIFCNEIRHRNDFRNQRVLYALSDI